MGSWKESWYNLEGNWATILQMPYRAMKTTNEIRLYTDTNRSWTPGSERTQWCNQITVSQKASVSGYWTSVDMQWMNWVKGNTKIDCWQTKVQPRQIEDPNTDWMGRYEGRHKEICWIWGKEENISGGIRTGRKQVRTEGKPGGTRAARRTRKMGSLW